MTLRTGGRILIDQLVAQGCDRIFCVPGESYLAALDALHDTPAIDLVVCRQEGGVAYAAEADGKLTGRPGVAFVTRGPGATNASIGVHTAMQDSTPMLLLIGDVSRGDRDREGFQEIDFAAMFSPLAKWAARCDDAARLPEYIARAYATAMSGRPGPVMLALPEDMLRDEVEAADRPRVHCPALSADPLAIDTLMELLKDACAPVAIVGGAGWGPAAAQAFAEFAERIGLPVASAFRRQDALPNDCPVYAGNLGYGPNPKLLQRVRDADLILAVGARLGEATTDGYTLITPDHPGKTLVHVHPDPNELGRVYRTDLPICADMREFTEMAEAWDDEVIHFDAGKQAHAEWLDWSTAKPTDAVLDLGLVATQMRDTLAADSVICNGAGNFSGWWHRYWRYSVIPSQLAPTNGSMGYGLPAGVAAALRHPDRQVIVLAGDGDFLMNGQELATAIRYGCRMLILVIDNSSYGTIRMHQERDYPGRIAGTDLANPDFAALARAYGAWADTVERTEDFAAALSQARDQTGVALLHLKTDVEQISAGTTIDKLRNRGAESPSEAIVGLYERNAASWVEDRGTDLHERPWLDRFAAPLARGATILDIGCGTGDPIARHFVSRGFAVTGVDSSPSLLGIAQSNLPEAEWIAADMRALDLDRRFDALLAWHSFFHLTPEDQRPMFARFAAHAAPGAMLIFTSGPAHGEKIGSWRGEPLYHGSLDPGEYEQLLDTNGFDIVDRLVGDPDTAAVWLARYRP